MQARKASIKETGEELSADDWERFDAAVAELERERKGERPSSAAEERPEGAERDGRAVA